METMTGTSHHVMQRTAVQGEDCLDEIYTLETSEQDEVATGLVVKCFKRSVLCHLSIKWALKILPKTK